MDAEATSLHMAEDILTDNNGTTSPSSSDLDEPASSLSSWEENHTEQAVPYEVKASPGKGLGVFATTQINRGTVIIEESPIIHLERQIWTPERVKLLVRCLPAEDFDKYMSLHSIHGLIEHHPTISTDDPITRARENGKWKARSKDEKSPYSVWVSNCMAAGSCDAVFFTISRINHSCIPNATFLWNEKKAKQEIRAVKDITAGEEITISYFNCTFYNKAQREDVLMRQYNFRCSCMACKDVENSTSFAAQSHSRRWQLAQLHQQQMEWANQPLQSMIDNRRDEIKLLEEEGIYDQILGRR
jgi:SET domain-containing protein